ncbi:MAG: hypothetical protein HY934_00905 [Candidatus Firestonebacteria bacterium]|nr:hypothetical protein [Candidatus Firestonebacteria bacterium]
MQENLNTDKNIIFNLKFDQNDIRNEYEKYLKEGAKLRHSASGRNTQTKNKSSLKLKLAFLAFGLISFYIFFNRYNNYLEEKEQKVLLEKEKIEREKEEALKLEQEKLFLDAQKNINNANAAIKDAESKNMEKVETAFLILKDSKAIMDNALEALKNKKYKEASSYAGDTLRKANDAIAEYEEKKEKNSQEKKKNKDQKIEKEVKKEASIPKEKTEEQKNNEKRENKENKEKEEKKILALKNKAAEILASVKKETSNGKEINLIKKHFSGKYTSIEAELINIETNMDNNKFNEVIQSSEKILVEIKKLKNDAEKEEELSQGKAKEAIQKIIEIQKSMKQKRLEQGK